MSDPSLYKFTNQETQNVLEHKHTYHQQHSLAKEAMTLLQKKERYNI